MHIPQFQKIINLLPIFAKCINFLPIFVQFAFVFWLNLCFLLPTYIDHDAFSLRIMRYTYWMPLCSVMRSFDWFF